MSEPISLVCPRCRLGESACTCTPAPAHVPGPLCRCGRPLVKDSEQAPAARGPSFACRACDFSSGDAHIAAVHSELPGHVVRVVLAPAPTSVPLLESSLASVGLEMAALVGAPRINLPPDTSASLYTCDEPGCDFGADDAFALAVHSIDVHGFEEVQPPTVILPVALACPRVCGACNEAGENTLTGALHWRRVNLSHEHLQAAVFVPLHSACADATGVQEALARLACGVMSEVLTVSDAPADTSKGGRHE